MVGLTASSFGPGRTGLLDQFDGTDQSPSNRVQLTTSAPARCTRANPRTAHANKPTFGQTRQRAVRPPRNPLRQTTILPPGRQRRDEPAYDPPVSFAINI